MLEVAVVVGAGGGIFAGAVLETKTGRRSVELTASIDARLYRLSESALLLRRLPAGERRSIPPTLSELDRVLALYSEDLKEFRELAVRDPEVMWMPVLPGAAVLARWGAKGERAARRLHPQK